MTASKGVGGVSFVTSFCLGLGALVFSWVPYWFKIEHGIFGVNYKENYSIFLYCVSDTVNTACTSAFLATAGLLGVARAAGSIGILIGFVAFILHMVWLCSCCSPTSKGVTVGAAACALCQGLCGVLAVIFFIAHFNNLKADLHNTFGLDVDLGNNMGFALWVYLLISVLLVIFGSIFVHKTRMAPDSPATQGMVPGQYPQGQVQQPQGYPNQAYAGQAPTAHGMQHGQ
ncbi:hypothetical protein CAPTEDRAFT_211894 [Capitella teleta]|uniref:MARVEL domain-containing protein n=1 Tax=Capitella teleta TaxID=283909 RepID=R7TZJ2_CAPTE|nr:hypothetical protein CAPTEDRAFT_211894 [Capitella teleta]|eukprot:ELT99368.1 hypothetical protein CAPTEDRAFT_211894 [Capitella teleta]